METLQLVLLMLVAVAGASALARWMPILPLPLVQIAVGVAIGTLSSADVALEPDLFFVLFLPPLLFLDGWRLPKDEVRRDLPTVIGLATALVICTVLGVGTLIHWLLPTMPLAVAFALAAVLSPTDPVAVSAIASRVAVPRRMMRVLEGEALLNDASGLVCLRFATAAAMTGTFSLIDAAGTFAWLAIGGLATGVGVVLLVLKAGDVLASRTGAEPGWQVLVTLLLPFASYLLAERIGASGILAAVGAGVTMTFAGRIASVGAATRVQGGAVWDFMQLALNGAMFVLLGEQLPRVFRDAHPAALDVGGWAELALAAAVILAALFALRFAWSWLAFRRSRGRDGMRDLSIRSAMRLTTAFSFAGVRGAITLAGILTLPFALPDGSHFPTRDLAIFLATVVILASLIAASFGLPFALRNLDLPAEDNDEDENERHLRAAILDASIAAVRAAGERRAEDDPAYADLARDIADRLDRQRPASADNPGDRVDRSRNERELHLVGLRAARDEAERLVRRGEAGSATTRRIVRQLDLSELRLED